MIVKNGEPIRDLEDWETRAGPKRALQWKDGRSAKETAIAWLSAPDSLLPKEVIHALSSHAHFSPVLSWIGEPEVRLPVDGRRGEPRNTDLLVTATDRSGPFLIAVEAKAAEPYANVMSKVLSKSLETLIENPRSGAMARAIDLATSMLRPNINDLPDLAGLRYQLFVAAVGALRYAEQRGINRVVLLFHEFVTVETTTKAHTRNSTDLNSWLSRISNGQYPSITSGSVVGPISLPGAPLFAGTSGLYLGKATRNLRDGHTKSDRIP